MAKRSRNIAHQEVIQHLMDAEKEAREQVKKAEEEADEIIESARREADERVRQAEESAKSEADEIVSEARELTETLDLGWEVPSLLPKEELTRVSEADIEAHYTGEQQETEA